MPFPANSLIFGFSSNWKISVEKWKQKISQKQGQPLDFSAVGSVTLVSTSSLNLIPPIPITGTTLSSRRISHLFMWFSRIKARQCKKAPLEKTYACCFSFFSRFYLSS